MDATKLIASGLALALVSMAAPAMASGPGGHGPDEGGFPGLPDQAMFGICNAFDHVDGNATVAAPFAWLSSSMCEDASHPGDGDRGDEDRSDERRGPPR